MSCAQVRAAIRCEQGHALQACTRESSWREPTCCISELRALLGPQLAGEGVACTPEGPWPTLMNTSTLRLQSQLCWGLMMFRQMRSQHLGAGTQRMQATLSVQATAPLPSPAGCRQSAPAGTPLSLGSAVRSRTWARNTNIAHAKLGAHALIQLAPFQVSDTYPASSA